MAKTQPKITNVDRVEGVKLYLQQALTRITALEDAMRGDRATMVQVEVARDEVSEANKLMQGVFRSAKAKASRTT